MSLYKQSLFSTHNSVILTNVLTAIAVGVWVPVRVTFMQDSYYIDNVMEVFILGLVILHYWAQHKDRAERLKEDFHHKQKSLFTVSQLSVDILVALPLMSFLYPIFGPSAKFALLAKLLMARHIFEVRKILDIFDGLHPVLARLIPLAFIMPLVVHICACGWVLLGSGTAGPLDDKLLEYYKAVYWAVTTLATVGYGDISAKTPPQMAFASVTMFIGVGFFGYVMSNVASMLARMDAAREEHLAKLDRVESFMRYNDVPSELRSKIRSYYRYMWESRKGYDVSDILHSLPKKLNSEISLFMNADIIEKVPMLKGAEQQMLQDIVYELKPHVLVPGEYIFHAGDAGDAMYFIQRGTIDIVSADGKVLATLHPGSFFGEMALITSNPRNASACASDYCDLFILKSEAFKKVLKRYPEFEKHLHATVAARAAPQKKSA